jgi:hypothetical protein
MPRNSQILCCISLSNSTEISTVVTFLEDYIQLFINASRAFRNIYSVTVDQFGVRTPGILPAVPIDHVSTNSKVK